MTHRFFIPLALMVGLLGLSACSTTSGSGESAGAPVTDSSQIDLERAGVRVDAAFKRALAQAEKSGDPAQVLSVMEPYFKRHREDPVLGARYARALREDNQLNAAERVLTPFTKGDKAHPEALTEMAMTQLSLGNYKQAETAARGAIKLDEKAGRAHLALGTALDAQGEYEEAEQSFRHGLKVWRGDAAPILNNLALNLASQERFEQALDILDRARKEYPGRVELERNYRIISTLHDKDYRPGRDNLKSTEKEDEVKEEAAAKDNESADKEPAAGDDKTEEKEEMAEDPGTRKGLSEHTQ